jgi:hypothetical protein
MTQDGPPPALYGCSVVEPAQVVVLVRGLCSGVEPLEVLIAEVDVGVALAGDSGTADGEPRPVVERRENEGARREAADGPG